ncbi:MAG: helix-turn-helix domain-containing protein [Actinobacteria bacterium]|nr:helix-turn-helix domain-containing protein [Actinomycetota bacterium]
MNDTYRTVSDVARDLGCSDDKVLRMIRQGKLPAVRVGRSYRILPADDAGAVATEPTAILPVDTTSQPDDAPLMVFDMTGTARQVDAVTATADALRLALNEVTADRDRLQAQLDAGTLAMSERDALKAQVTILAMRVDALTLMRDQTAQEHERTVDALQSLVASQRETIDGQSATIADLRAEIIRLQAVDASRDAVLVDLSQRVRWWPSVLRAFGLVS